MRTVHVLVQGTVQGVGFRYHCAYTAQELGVVGQVRNLPDGDVEVTAQGEPEAVGRLIAGRMRRAPSAPSAVCWPQSRCQPASEPVRRRRRSMSATPPPARSSRAMPPRKSAWVPVRGRPATVFLGLAVGEAAL